MRDGLTRAPTASAASLDLGMKTAQCAEPAETFLKQGNISSVPGPPGSPRSPRVRAVAPALHDAGRPVSRLWRQWPGVTP